MSEDQGKRLADLLAEREKFIAEEKDRRKEAKDALEALDGDIAKLAEAIRTGQADLFEEDDMPRSTPFRKTA